MPSSDATLANIQGRLPMAITVKGIFITANLADMNPIGTTIAIKFQLNVNGTTNTALNAATGTPATPATPTLAGLGAGNVDNGTHSYRVTFVTNGYEGQASNATATVNVVDKTTNGQINLTSIALGPTGTTARNVYRTVAGNAGQHKLVGTVSDNVTTTFLDNVADASLGNAFPWTPNAPNTPTLAGAGAGNVDNGTHSYRVTFVTDKQEFIRSAATATVNVVDKTTNGQVSLTGINTGPIGTTARKIYRTVSGNAGNHLLVGTISDNTTTTFTDNVADASLGVAVPTVNPTYQLYGTDRINVTTVSLATDDLVAHEATFTGTPSVRVGTIALKYAVTG